MYYEMIELVFDYWMNNILAAQGLWQMEKLDRFIERYGEIFDEMRQLNIGVHVYYIPVYWQSYHEELGYKKGICPAAERWYEQALTLPISPKMLKIL